MSSTAQAGRLARLRDKLRKSRGGSKQETEHQTENHQTHTSNDIIPGAVRDALTEATIPTGNGTAPVVSPGPTVSPGLQASQPYSSPSRHIVSEEVASIHKALWDKAYSNLMNDKDKAKYMTKYEELLSTMFHIKDLQGESVPNLGEHQMNQIVTAGLEKIEKYKNALDHSEGTIKTIEAVKAILDIPLKNIPQAALPWAIISSTVEIFLKPVKVGVSLYNGVGHVVTRIEFYSDFTDRLLSQEGIRDGSALMKIRQGIATRITDLYQPLLFYQIKSVCFYHRNQVAVLARGILDLDDWNGDLEGIKDAEDLLLRDSTLYGLEKIYDQGKNISMDKKTEEESENFLKRLRAIRRVDPAIVVQDIQIRREKAINEVYKWIFETDEFKAFVKWEGQEAPGRLWISGQAGTGKTMLLIGAIQEIQDRGLLNTGHEEPPAIIYFFCQHTDIKLRNGAAVLQSLTWMLLQQQPHLLAQLGERFFDSEGKFSYDRDSVSTWSSIFTNMLKTSGRVVIAIDALDECEEETRKHLKDFIDDTLLMKELSHVKWLITSRPIFELARSMPDKNLEKQNLLALDDCNLTPYIDAYINQKMVGLRHNAKNKRRLDKITEQLRERASNTFLWASLVIQRLEDKPEASWNRMLEEIPDGLDKLYEYLLTGIEDPECKDVLVVTMLARRPLMLREIEQLAGLEAGVDAGRDFVILCKSFLALRDETVYLIHQSAQDWLLKNRQRLRDAPLQDLHALIFKKSLEGQGELLKENVYGLSHHGILSEEAKPPKEDPLWPICYSCQYWVYHLGESQVSPSTDVLEFLQAHFLHWLEAMALLKLLPETVQIVDKLQSLAAAHAKVEISDFLLDAKRFVPTSLPAMTVAPLQIYVSALIFAPTASLVRQTGTIPAWIHTTPLVDEEWGSLLQTIETSSDMVRVALSPDNQLVGGADGGRVRLWDTKTGILKKELDCEGPGSLLCCEFSADGQMLVSGSSDDKIYIWETAKWNLTPILDHSSGIDASAGIETAIFSPNSSVLACSSPNGNINVWIRDTNTWNLKWSFHHSGNLLNLSFCPKSLLLAAGTQNDEVSIWNLATGELQPIIQCPEPLKAAKFSQDDQFLLTLSFDGIICFWDTDNWSLKQESQVPERCFDFATSPDNKYLATSGENRSIVVRERNKGTVSQIAHGHTNSIRAITFSSDSKMMATSAQDRTIRLWANAPGKSTKNLDKHSGLISDIRISPDGSLVTTSGGYSEVKFWDASTGHLKRTVDNMGVLISTARISANNRILASGSSSGTVIVRNVQSGEPIVERNGNGYIEGPQKITDIQFSRSSKLLGARTASGLIEVWNTETGNHVMTQYGEEFEGEELARFLNSLEQEICLGETDEFFEDELPLGNVLTSQQCQISVVGNWVILGKQKSIWLPPNHRPYRSRGWDQTNNILAVVTPGKWAEIFAFDPVAMSAGQLQTFE
ncbi:WD40 repeat-like protein [Penicillium samsonianum]|uniref:WD40 repeat-like protein n=1 Tax=Penicillium samsonianum TaxID=1882272 RepID=UPI002547A01B|nr:WD40 repeat-like protein [Penicillium samsonianum]KAJ6133577.1 WD40 repeat-like protein [Penicillium samsonianum]